MKHVLSKSLIIVGLLFILVQPPFLGAFTPCLPDGTIDIITETTAGDMPGSRPAVSRLILRPVQSGNDACHVGFFTPGAEVPAGILKFMPTGSIAWDGLRADIKQFQEDHLLIIPGFAMPVDVLPVDRFPVGAEAVEPLEFEFHRQAGGRTFVDRLRITAHAVSMDEALGAQWIRIKEDDGSELRMIEAMDLQTGELIVRQLWASGQAWWLYEETPYRRSWRIQQVGGQP